MKKNKLGSMVFQVEFLLNQINCISMSKHEAKKKVGNTNKVKGIYSIRYFRKVLNTCIRFCRWARKQFGVMSVFDLKPEHHVAFIKDLEDKGSTKGYMINIESHLKKLQTSMNHVSKKNQRPPIVFLVDRLILWGEKEKPQDRSYTDKEIQKLEHHISDNVAAAMRMSLNLGFRTVTVCNVRVEHVLIHPDGNVEIYIPVGRGITKGGRFLGPLKVPSSYVPELLQLIEDKEPEEKILPLKENTIRQGLKRACDASGVQSAGAHGFRHTYARKQLESIMGERFEEGKMMIDFILKNREKGRRADHSISKSPADPDRQLFEWVQDCVNIVHSSLGHGKSRWALVAVYMHFKRNEDKDNHQGDDQEKE